MKGLALARKDGMSSPAMMTTTLGSRSSGAIFPRADSSGSTALPRLDEPVGLRRVERRMSSATAMRPIMSANPRKRYGVGVLQSPAWCADPPPPTPASAAPSLTGLIETV